MEGTTAIYMGRIVDKKNFRTFVYSTVGERRLVESWDEFEDAMASGIWFSTPHDAKDSLNKKGKKPKAKTIKDTEKVAVETKKEASNEVYDEPPDEAAFEVTTDDGFLPKES